MNYYVSPREFRELLESYVSRENERLQQENPESPVFEIREGTRKVNSPDEGALFLRERGSRIAPTIQLHKLRADFRDWMDRNRFSNAENLQDRFFQDIFRTMEENVTKNQEMMREVEKIQDPENALSRITPCICKTSRNEEFLSTIPHREIHDLSIYYRINLDYAEDPETCPSVVIRSGMVELWNLLSETPITEETLYGRAYENERKESRIFEMDQLIMDIYPTDSGTPEDEHPYSMPEAEYEKMFVVTNRMKYYGAADALMGIRMDEFIGQKDMDFYILPSSIHECILIGDDGTFQARELAGFVRSVNATEVSMEERLSDNVYFYDHKTRSVQLAYDADATLQKYQSQTNSRNYRAAQQTPRRGR